MEAASLFIYDPNEMKYRFHDDHPFNQKRLDLTTDLLRHTGALSTSDTQKPKQADEEELLLNHTREYIDAVKKLSRSSEQSPDYELADKFGLHTDDTPFFPGMHEITSYVVGGSLIAAHAVMQGKTKRALHLAGGLHHAMPNKGAGFCVYNDASIAIAAIRKTYKARVLYVDTDVHHGDGVQWSFYTDSDVCTFSIHETGRYLFPGTGGVQERGDHQGFGWSINLPLEPYTEDESWLASFTEVFERVLSAFKPDVIVSQHGCDAHAFDPLAHIHCSMNIYLHIPRIIREAADRWCGGRWIALGGGGYDIWRVVPRAWSLLWLEMIRHPLPDLLRSDPRTRLPETWLERWRRESPVPLPLYWLDPADEWEPMPRRKEITLRNKVITELAMIYLPT
ncbi:acetoin utilization protein AcuC [Gorillibacterium massiliense]|uniref:acetoin utilization protein AcuC n=1 Tax=Gorillibacterium massiliense TaxID=1280390 RepID=UPI0004AE2635|nr:acetoin utilization protein AcuC [Gorillibacterium massiliense]